MAMRGIIAVVTGCLILWTSMEVQGMQPPAISFPNFFPAPYPPVSPPKMFFNQDMQLPLMRPYHPWRHQNHEHNPFQTNPFQTNPFQTNPFQTSPFNWPLQWFQKPNYNRFKMPTPFSSFGQNVFPPMPQLPYSIFEPQTFIDSNPIVYNEIPAVTFKDIKLDAQMDKSINNQQNTDITTPADNQPLPNTETPVNEQPLTTAAVPVSNPHTTTSPTNDQSQTTPENEQPQTIAAALMNNPQTTVSPTNHEAQTTPANEHPETTATVPESNPQTTISTANDQGKTTPANEPQTTAAAPIDNSQSTVSPINDQSQTTLANEQPQTTVIVSINNSKTTISPPNPESQTTPANEQPQTTAAALKDSPQTTASPTNAQTQTTVAAPTNTQLASTPQTSSNDQPQSTAAVSVSDQPQQSQTDNTIIVLDKSEVGSTMSPSTEYSQQEAVSSADTVSTVILASASPSPPQSDVSSDSTTTKSSISIFIPSENGRSKVRAVLVGPGSFSGSSGSSGSSITGTGNIAILDPEALQRDISTFTAMKPPQMNPIMISSQAGIPSFPNLSGGSSASIGVGNMDFPQFLVPGVQFQQNDGRIPEDSQPSVVFPGIMKDSFLNNNFQNPFL